MRARGVIGTAGHVDHGKTALVRALTGHDGDRLPEEKRRGITITLGFAHWETERVSASVIDVPGHERFVGTMVAGAAGIDAVMLVVAADDGVMPQTREHLAICGQLGIARGVIAISKCDLADESTIALVEDDVRETTRGTFLERAERVRCSAKTGVGIAELASALERVLIEERREAPRQGPVWLPIDRVFTKHGHGTIATGTLVRGTIAEGDTLTLLAGETSTKVIVRGLHAHGGAISKASAAGRVAVNLRAIESDAIPLGAVLTTPGFQEPTRAIDVQLGHELALGPRTELALHLGASQIAVRARSHGALTRLVSESAFATYAGDRFVLRRPDLASDRTIGGGVVVDPHPALPRPKPHDGDADPTARVLRMIVERPRGVSRRALVMRLPPDVRAQPILDRLLERGEILEVTSEDGPQFVASSELPRAKTAVREALVAFHASHPALGGATIAELAGGVSAPWRPLVPIATAALVREGAIAGGDRLAARGHDALALADRVAAIYTEAGATPLGDAIAREKAGLPERTFDDVIAELVRRGRIERIATGTHVDRAALDALGARVRSFFDTHETLSPGDFKSLTGLTRKNAIAMLEWLDRHGITRRKGETRVRA